MPGSLIVCEARNRTGQEGDTRVYRSPTRPYRMSAFPPLAQNDRPGLSRLSRDKREPDKREVWSFHWESRYPNSGVPVHAADHPTKHTARSRYQGTVDDVDARWA